MLAVNTVSFQASSSCLFHMFAAAPLEVPLTNRYLFTYVLTYILISMIVA